MLRAISMIWVLLAASCAGTGHPSLLENCPVTPMAVKDLPQGLLLRARVRMSARNHEASFEVIAHATTKELTLVGIAPYGMRLFEMQQSGLGFHQTTSASAEAQVLAILTADALYRAYWIEPPGQKNSWVRDGETITDSDTGSKRRRSFVQKGGPPGSGHVTIDYDHESSADDAPGARIENPWCGYRAVVVPLKTENRNQEP